MKIFQNKFLTSTCILILSGMATKLLGLIIKIIFTRIVGNTTISLYTLVMPTYSLLLSIADFAMPTTIAKLYAEKKHSYLLNNAIIIIFIINFIMVGGMILLSPFIAKNLLNNPNTYPLLISCSLCLPLSSTACILKGYFYGKQKMLPHAISNTIEQLIRLFLVLTILPKLIKISYVYAACGLILTTIFTEAGSIITFLLFMPKKDIIDLTKIKFNKQTSQSIVNMSLPIVNSRIISNIAYFLEPIILTKILLYTGFSREYIMLEYGAYNAYAISTLCIPSFFVSAIAMALIPEITKLKNNKIAVKRRLKEAFLYAAIVGLFSSLGAYFFRYPLLKFLYNTRLGVDYIKLLAPFFFLFYLEPIFNSFLQCYNKTKEIFKISVFSSLIKIICIIIIGLLKKGIYALIYSEILNIIIVIVFYSIIMNKTLKN